MLTDAVFGRIVDLLNWLSGLLPLGSLSLPSPQDIGTAVGQYGGPFDKIIPLAEAATCGYVLLTVWLPVSVVYTIAMFVFTHMPFIGKGN